MEKFHPSTSNSKPEKRIKEKDRRHHFKNLYSQLYSLLPSDISKEVLPVPDKIGEAINYIKSMERKLENYKQMKEKLLCGRRQYSSTKSSELMNVEVHDMGPDTDMILISGLKEPASFYGKIRLLHEEGFEVVNANFSNNGNSMLQVVHEKGGISTSSTETTEIAKRKRLKELIYGYSHGEVESTLDLWDFEIEPDLLDSGFLGPLPAGQFSFLPQN
ncbi:transcription factor bHLH162-like isoform X1 [Coffea eugenioides]|uniref:transcription factor bHLH162-like isoform X1 n=1 Tax=Coffea eugenioides TaxID=49369 RepID=UPI000F612217|nr:transcription factor bHLH162-like isoform X1 [Coffea eugenioides]